ncbi:hypothetical protein ILUMI_02372 [Ignelater luminosus]|uniref:Uncharacterized protein n=1 Tax=Ignelater luminosus TaxID=2038154 RepID=A0A8K0GGI0_IGNLU|nr:hypothetical protein ILUMI_02372 [Ignelater luminosus]
MDDFGKPGVYILRDKSEKEDCKKNNCSPEEEKTPSCLQNLKYYIWEYCDTYQKWVHSPVIVTFATTQTPIWKIPFPAVTICSEIKAKKSRFNYTDIYIKKKKGEPITAKEEQEFEYMSLICDTPKELLNTNLTTSDQRAMDFLMEVAPDFDKMMFRVSWRGKRYKNITDLFTPILTSEGLCYTFNIMDRSEIFTDIVTNYRDSFSTFGKVSKYSIQSGYDPDATLDSYPRRSFIASIFGGLRVLLSIPREDIDYACIDAMQGFKVILHHPSEVPRGKLKYFRVPLDHSVTVAVKPNMMTTAKELSDYKPKDRRCYFSSERKLKYFKLYNQQNCLSECLIDFTLETCGCVGFHMQRQNSTPICSASKLKCVIGARAIYLANEVKKKVRKVNAESKDKIKDDSGEKCDCLPACNSLDFEMERSQAIWEWKEFLKIEQEVGEWNSENVSLDELHFARVVIFFKEMQFITSERNELYGQTDFLANCGGLLGLFTGFSFMSALEILYYLTLRFVCNLRKFGKHYWSGSEELLEKNKKLNNGKSN